jgi:tetratricopeptide (TPR) repeat protein
VTGPLYAGLLAEVQNHPDDALKDYQRALELDPTGQQPLNAAVQLLLRQKKYELALGLADKVIAKAPQDAFAVNIKGEVLAAQQRWPEAQAAFQSASTLQPKWWVPYRNEALVHLAQKDPEASIKVLKDGTEKVDQPEVLATDLTSLLQRQGRNDEAIALYEGLLAKHADSDLVANNLAMLLATNRADAASLTRAATMASRFSQSRNPDYLDTYGWVLLRQGKANAALPVFEKAVALAPESGLVRYHLALTQFAAGQKQVARDNLERALQGKQEFDGIADARAKLTEWKQAG